MKQTVTLEPKEIEALRTIAQIKCETVKCADCPMDISRTGCMKILSKQTLNALYGSSVSKLYGSMVQSVTTEDISSIYKSPVRDNTETYPLSEQTDLTFNVQPRYSYISQMNDNKENNK